MGITAGYYGRGSTMPIMYYFNDCWIEPMGDPIYLTDAEYDLHRYLLKDFITLSKGKPTIDSIFIYPQAKRYTVYIRTMEIRLDIFKKYFERRDIDFLIKVLRIYKVLTNVPTNVCFKVRATNLSKSRLQYDYRMVQDDLHHNRSGNHNSSHGIQNMGSSKGGTYLTRTMGRRAE